MDEPFVLCDSPPLFVLVKHNGIGALSFTGLDTDVTPLYPIESRSDVDGVSFSRMQIPITPGFAITNFKSQGATYESAILDLKITPSNTTQSASRSKINHKHYTSLNVQLGRVKSFAGVWLREPIQLSDVQSRPDPALEIEVQRLVALEQNTITAWTSVCS
jgi:hypothetical protein